MQFSKDTDLYRVIGSNIKHFREQAQMTQVQLADADLADFFFCHWRSADFSLGFRSIPQETDIGSSMGQAFRLPVRIADQAGI